MSRVIGFRLDSDNPREAQREAGYSTRHVLTEALLGLEMIDDESAVDAQLAGVAIALDALNRQLSQLHAAPRV